MATPIGRLVACGSASAVFSLVRLAVIHKAPTLNVKQIKASVYRKDGRCLLVALNTDTASAHAATLTPDAKALGLDDDWKAVDAETGKAVARKGGAFDVRLSPRDWQCILLDANGSNPPDRQGEQQ